MANYLNVFLGEFFGTAILILLGNGVVAATLLKKTNTSKSANFMMIAMGWGMAVFVGVLVAASLGAPGYLNPAVAMKDIIAGLYDTTGEVAESTILVALFSIPVTIAGAIFGQFCLHLLYLDAYKKEDDHGLVLATHSTGPAIRNLKNNFLTEFIATSAFVGAIVAIGLPGGPGTSGTDAITTTSLKTLPVALLVLSIGLSLGGPTGYAINPARDLGPRIFHALAFKGRNSDWGYSWVPVAGPLAGGALVGLCVIIMNAAAM